MWKKREWKSMPHNLIDLCKFRMEQGQAALESSQILFKQNDIRGSNFDFTKSKKREVMEKLSMVN